MAARQYQPPHHQPTAWLVKMVMQSKGCKRWVVGANHSAVASKAKPCCKDISLLLLGCPSCTCSHMHCTFLRFSFS